MSGDRADERLRANVHPADWGNPQPRTRYDLVAVGGGTAGLVAAIGAAALGARTALVERNLLGGDCLNYGCVPSKTLIRSARAMAEIGRAGRFGITVPEGAAADFGAVMARVREVRARISAHDSAARLRDEFGVDVFLGQARFIGPDALDAGGKTLRFRKAVIATGARPVSPPIPGLAEAGALTNETVFDLTARPERLAVIGGGPLGCELAQAFARLGCRVTVLERGPRILPREDPAAAAALMRAFEADGIEVVRNVKSIEAALEDGRKAIHVEADGQERVIAADEVLVGAGRAPNVEGLNLEAAGVSYDGSGVAVDDRLRTANPRIFAAGDVALPYKFTHAADASARLAVQNALFAGRKKVSALTIPWTTYTDPEIARVGLDEAEARARGMAVESFTREFREVDRAVTDGEEDGLVKIVVARRGRIVGATVVAAHAGEMIGELTLAMTAGIGLGRLASVIHPYPTQAEAIKQLGDAYNRRRLTPSIKTMLKIWLRLSR